MTWPSLLMMGGLLVIGELFLSGSVRSYSDEVLLSEICDNLIDDDGDGRIDVFDTDCSCDRHVGSNILSNGDFESIDQCCLSIQDENGNCIKDWYLVTPSPDYLSPECGGNDIPLFDSEEITYDSAFVGLGISSGTNMFNRSESIGTCLSTPLLAGGQYTISIDLAILSALDFTMIQGDMNYSIYGLTKCPDSSDLSAVPNFCESALALDAQELMAVNLNNLTRDSWETFEVLVVPDNDIEAIILHSQCAQDVMVIGAGFLYVDNVEIKSVQSAWSYDSDIIINGDVCQPQSLAVRESDTVQYQWYLDSIPFINGDDAVLPVLTGAAGAYHVQVSNDNGCQLIGPFIVESPPPKVIVETLCPGETYTFGQEVISEHGIYFRQDSSGAGCDTTITLLLTVPNEPPQGFIITPGAQVAVGTPLSIDPHPLFFHSLRSHQWKENGQDILDLDGSLELTRSDLGTTVYSLEYESIAGCLYTEEIMIEWVDQLEDCFNGMDDDGDTTIDVYDPDCRCEAGASENYILNGDFEINDNCLVIENSNFCLDDWIDVNGSVDYYNFRDPFYFSDIFTLESSVIGMGIFSSHETGGSESMATCLTRSVLPGESYVLAFDIILFEDRSENLFYTVYGIPKCEKIPGIGIRENFCFSDLVVDAEDLFTINLKDLNRDEWSRIETTITPASEHEAIVLNSNCAAEGPEFGTYILFDNIALAPIIESFDYNSEIIINGTPCSDSIELLVEEATDVNFQWYRDEVPLPGATNHRLVVTPDSSSGVYSLYAFNDYGCILIEEAAVDTVVSLSIMDTICEGQTYIFQGEELSESGVYSKAGGMAQNGCDSVVVLELFVVPRVLADLDISPGTSLSIGEELTIRLRPDFLDAIRSFQWKEDGQLIDSEDQEVLVAIEYEETTRRFSLEYEDSNGCLSTAFISVEWKRDVDSAMFCLSDISDSICLGRTYLFAGMELSESGSYQDTLSGNMCDSIVTLMLHIVEPWSDTIDAVVEEGQQYDFYGVQYDQAGFYSAIESTDGDFCDTVHYLNLIVKSLVHLYIPNIMNLGSTLGNDNFYISASEPIEITEMQVFDRWGGVVYEHSNFVTGDGDIHMWDGTHRGQRVSSGIYIYRIIYFDREEVSHQLVGDITIVN